VEVVTVAKLNLEKGVQAFD